MFRKNGRKIEQWGLSVSDVENSAWDKAATGFVRIRKPKTHCLEIGEIDLPEFHFGATPLHIAEFFGGQPLRLYNQILEVTSFA